MAKINDAPIPIQEFEVKRKRGYASLGTSMWFAHSNAFDVGLKTLPQRTQGYLKMLACTAAINLIELHPMQGCLLFLAPIIS